MRSNDSSAAARIRDLAHHQGIAPSGASTETVVMRRPLPPPRRRAGPRRLVLLLLAVVVTAAGVAGGYLIGRGAQEQPAPANLPPEPTVKPMAAPVIVPAAVAGDRSDAPPQTADEDVATADETAGTAMPGQAGDSGAPGSGEAALPAEDAELADDPDPTEELIFDEPDELPAKRSRSRPARDAALAATGTLSVGSKPPCRIIIDGVPIGLTTPQRNIELPVGRHTVRLVNEQHGLDTRDVIVIRQGQETKLIRDLTGLIRGGPVPDE